VTVRRHARIAAAIAIALSLRAGIVPAAEIPCGALAPARREAVQRGTAYLKIFFEGEEKRAALGTDAVSIFLELGETAADPDVARRAMREARRLSASLARGYTKPGGLDAHESLMGALSLLPDSGPLHLSKKSSLSLLSSVTARLAGRDPDEVYYGARIDASRLAALDGDALFDLLIAAYTVERARLAFPALPVPALGLGEVIRFALARPYASFGSGDDERAGDDFYLATHVAYVLSDYSRIRLSPASLGAILPYLRAQVPHVLAERDTEAGAEIADVLRQTGATDADADVCRLARLLLDTQRPDGSWPRADAEDAYDTVHPTWVGVHSLRERTFLPGGAWAERVRALLAAPPAARVP
jgi:hypothetical protein